MKKILVLCVLSMSLFLISGCGMVVAAELNRELSKYNDLNEFHMDMKTSTKITVNSVNTAVGSVNTSGYVRLDPFYVLIEDGEQNVMIEPTQGFEGEDAYGIYTFNDDPNELGYYNVREDIVSAIPEEYAGFDFSGEGYAEEVHGVDVETEGDGYHISADAYDLLSEDEREQMDQLLGQIGETFEEGLGTVDIYYEFRDEEMYMDMDVNISIDVEGDGLFSQDISLQIYMGVEMTVQPDQFEYRDIHQENYRIFNEYAGPSKAVELTDPFEKVVQTLTYEYSTDVYKIELDPGYYTITNESPSYFSMSFNAEFLDGDENIVNLAYDNYVTVLPKDERYENSIFHVTTKGTYYLKIQQQMRSYNFTITPIDSPEAYLNGSN